MTSRAAPRILVECSELQRKGTTSAEHITIRASRRGLLSGLELGQKVREQGVGRRKRGARDAFRRGKKMLLASTCNPTAVLQLAQSRYGSNRCWDRPLSFFSIHVRGGNSCSATGLRITNHCRQSQHRREWRREPAAFRAEKTSVS